MVVIIVTISRTGIDGDLLYRIYDIIDNQFASLCLALLTTNAFAV